MPLTVSFWVSGCVSTNFVGASMYAATYLINQNCKVGMITVAIQPKKLTYLGLAVSVLKIFIAPNVVLGC